MEPTTDEQFVSQILGETAEETESAPQTATEPEGEEPATVEATAEPEAEQDEAEQEPEAPEEPAKFKVKVDGEEREVTLDELLRGYSGQGKIQKGMAEAAEAKKQAAAEKAQAAAVLQALQVEQQRVLEVAQALQTQGLIPPPKAPDPKLSEKDPIAYTREFAKYQQAAQAYQAQQATIAEIEARQQAASEAAMRAHLTAQAEALKERIPEFANPETAAKTRAKLIEAGTKHYGYSEQELMGVMDARAVQVLNDAAKWRELQARTAEAKKSPDAPRNVKPSAKRPEPAQLVEKKIIERARKTQSADDWAAYIMNPS